MVVLFDIDDTLIKNKEYPKNYAKIVKLITLLKKNNISFGLCTYRPYNESVKKIFSDYKLNGPIITEGGASNNLDEHPISPIIENIIKKYLKENNLNINVKIDNNYEDIASIIINKDRKKTSTIRFPKILKTKIDLIIKYLKNYDIMNNMNINISRESDLKINIAPKDIDKISVIEKLDDKIIFITDYEDVLPPHSSKILVYSVGDNIEFNKKCDKTFSIFGSGIEEILKMLGENYERI